MMKKLLAVMVSLMLMFAPLGMSAKALESIVKNYSDGSQYFGWVENDVPNGFGIMQFANGDMYYGEWAGGLRAGFGAYLFAGGGMQAGFWENNGLSGMGMTLSKDGARYEGFFSDNRPNGQGFTITQDGTMYSGEWTNGQRDGGAAVATGCLAPVFTATYLNGSDMYLGETLGSVLEGYGVYCFTNGDYYVGQFSGGHCNGYGLYVNVATQGYMAGRFVNDLPDGIVTSHYLDGTVYTSLPGGETAGGTAQDSGVCITCHGTGRCPICRGTGTYSNYGFSNDCTACNGTGDCYTCHGTGFGQ